MSTLDLDLPEVWGAEADDDRNRSLAVDPVGNRGQSRRDRRVKLRLDLSILSLAGLKVSRETACRA